jgi:cardiolipin synthase
MRTRRIDFRSHRKIVVCDGRVAFTGGMNVMDAQSAELSPKYWRDTHLRLEGSAALAIQRVFVEDWLFATGAAPPRMAELFPTPGEAGRHVVQVVASGPDRPELPIHDTFFALVNHARTRLWLTTPYFVPTEALVTALCTTARRGVDVRLIIPRKSDSLLIDLAAHSYVPELLASGVKVFEYLPRFIHAKTMVVDDDIAVVGTANLDNRSFRLNFELVTLLYDVALTTRLASAFEADQAESRPLARIPLDHQKLPRRLGESLARLLSPLL